MQARAYYIKNTSDFMTVVKYLNLCHKFTEKHFCGTDWYFFYNECDDYEDRYWVETLTVKNRSGKNIVNNLKNKKGRKIMAKENDIKIVKVEQKKEIMLKFM